MSDKDDLRDEARTEDWLNGRGAFRGRGPAFDRDEDEGKDEPDPEPKAIPLEAGQTCYWITCPTHGSVNLTREDYQRQMADPDSKWKCFCGLIAEWDDAKHEATQDEYYTLLELERSANEDNSAFGPDE